MRIKTKESIIKQIEEILAEYNELKSTFTPLQYSNVKDSKERAHISKLITNTKVLISNHFDGEESQYFKQIDSSCNEFGKYTRNVLESVMAILTGLNENLKKDYESVAKAKSETSDNTLGTLNHLENSLIHKIYEEIIANPTRYHKESRNITPQRKKTVKVRDNYICQMCSEEFEEDELEVDHILPYSAGGSNEEYNLMALCNECNGNKSASLDYYRSDEGKFKLMENIKELVKTLPMIHNFGNWLEKMGDKRKRK